jgi:hypothetical protein
MDSVANDYPDVLLGQHEGPCLSLYQPTHRSFPDSQQDPIRFRNLIKEMELTLQQRYPGSDAESLLAPFRALIEDKDFWNHTFDGLAVLGAPGLFRVYRLQRPVAELAVVADSFHTKPLMRIVQSSDRYQILGLDRHQAKLFEGNRDGLDEIAMAPQVPRTIEQAFDRDIERERSMRTYGRASSESSVRQGTDVRQASIDSDTEQFFRAVDRAVLEHHSRPTGLPLLLAALPDNQGLFRGISHNPHLVAEAIDTNPDALSIDALRERAWALVQPHYLQRLAGLIDAFQAARNKGQGSDELGEVAEAAVAGRVASLLVEADRQIPGRLDTENGAIERQNAGDSGVDDLLDDIAEVVLRAGGEVVLVPVERMPTRTGLAATYRY